MTSAGGGLPEWVGCNGVRSPRKDFAYSGERLDSVSEVNGGDSDAELDWAVISQARITKGCRRLTAFPLLLKDTLIGGSVGVLIMIERLEEL